MLVLIMVAYIIISTYYLIGLIDCFKNVVETDRKLKVYMKKCGTASSIFSAILLILFSYSWPVIFTLSFTKYFKKRAAWSRFYVEVPK